VPSAGDKVCATRLASAIASASALNTRLKPAAVATAAVAVPTANAKRSCTDGGQAGTAFRLVNTVAAKWSGGRTARGMMDKRGATMGKKPSAVSRAAVWVAPGSGLVIKTRFKGLLLLERFQT
jgi:hypothetical protein